MIASSPHSPITIVGGETHSQHSSPVVTVRGSPCTSGSPRHAGSRSHHNGTVTINEPIQRRGIALPPLPPSYEASRNYATSLPLSTESALLPLHRPVTSSREHSIPANHHLNDKLCFNRGQDGEELDEVKAEQQPLITSSAAYNRKFEPTYFRWNAAATQRSFGSRRQSTNAVSSGAALHVQTADELDELVNRYRYRSIIFI